MVKIMKKPNTKRRKKHTKHQQKIMKNPSKKRLKITPENSR